VESDKFCEDMVLWVKGHPGIYIRKVMKTKISVFGKKKTKNLSFKLLPCLYILWAAKVEHNKAS
jgi:hypothetical protein